MLEEIQTNVRKLQEEVKVLQAQVELLNLRIPNASPCQGQEAINAACELKKESVCSTSKDNNVSENLEVEENIQGISVGDKEEGDGGEEITRHDKNCSGSGEVDGNGKTGTDLNIVTWTRLLTVPELNTPVTGKRLVRLLKENGSLGIGLIPGLNENGTRWPNRISSIEQGMSAARTGQLFVGDRILSVNGEDLQNSTYAEAVKALRMAGEVVELVVEFVNEDVTPYFWKPPMLGELGWERGIPKNSIGETPEEVKEDSLSMSTGNNCVFIVRESLGTYGLIGTARKPWKILNKVEEETRFTTLSSDGRYLAIGKESSMDIQATNDSVAYANLPYQVLTAQFSTQSKFLVTWEEPGNGVENFKIWSLDDVYEDEEASQKFDCPIRILNLVYCQALSKLPQIDFSWNDEFVSRTCNDKEDVHNECVLFYATPDFHNAITLTNSRYVPINGVYWSPGANQLTFLAYCDTGYYDQTRIGMYKYPEIGQTIVAGSITRKECVSFKWNHNGTAVMVTSRWNNINAVDSDTVLDLQKYPIYESGAVEFFDINKGECQQKFGLWYCNWNNFNVIACEWRPNSAEYCVIFGEMPYAQAALKNYLTHNGKMHMGVGHRNEIHFNPEGNIVLLCGVGKDFPGEIDIWELEKYKKCIARVQHENVTQVEWLNDGIHFITATTSPMMELNNGFKIWDFTGNLVSEWKAEKQLYSIASLPIPRDQLEFPKKMLDDHIKAMPKIKISPHAKAVNAPSAKP